MLTLNLALLSVYWYNSRYQSSSGCT